MLNGYTNLIIEELSRTLLELPCEKDYPFNILGVVCRLFDKGTSLAVVDIALLPFNSLFLFIIV